MKNTFLIVEMKLLPLFFFLTFSNVVLFISSDALKTKWDSYKHNHGKVYANVFEEISRKQIFARNLLRIREHNRLYTTGKALYIKGINQFTDMLDGEIAERSLSYVMTNKSVQHELLDNSSDTIVGDDRRSIPKQKDWRKNGVVTSVKNQGDCSSCWAFSAAGALEALFATRKNKSLESISAQNIIDCSKEYGNVGCNGGNVNKAFKYVYNNNGIDFERKYSYEGKDHKPCRYDPKYSAGFLTKLRIIPQDEKILRNYIAKNGPVSAAIDATNLHAYEKGIYSDSKCDAENVNHAVLIVGYGTDEKSGKDYWLIKNSWGEKWGENGYFRLLRNKQNHCGIATDASIPLATD